MNDRRPAFAAALLAGGKSSRMGADKALLDWHGAPLWRGQLGKLIELNPDRLLLSCREEQHLKNVFAEFVFDPPDNPGPLGAIVRCLEVANAKERDLPGPGERIAGGTEPVPLLVLAVDMPHMTPAFLLSMLKQCDGSSAGLVCRRGTGNGVPGPFLEPLCAVYPAAALPLMREALAGRNLKMQDAVESLVAAGLMQVRGLNAGEVPLFFNANTPEEYTWTKSAPPASS